MRSAPSFQNILCVPVVRPHLQLINSQRDWLIFLKESNEKRLGALQSQLPSTGRPPLEATTRALRHAQTILTSINERCAQLKAAADRGPSLTESEARRLAEAPLRIVRNPQFVLVSETLRSEIPIAELQRVLDQVIRSATPVVEKKQVLWF